MQGKLYTHDSWLHIWRLRLLDLYYINYCITQYDMWNCTCSCNCGPVSNLEGFLWDTPIKYAGYVSEIKVKKNKAKFLDLKVWNHEHFIIFKNYLFIYVLCICMCYQEKNHLKRQIDNTKTAKCVSGSRIENKVLKFPSLRLQFKPRIFAHTILYFEFRKLQNVLTDWHVFTTVP